MIASSFALLWLLCVYDCIHSQWRSFRAFIIVLPISLLAPVCTHQTRDLTTRQQIWPLSVSLFHFANCSCPFSAIHHLFRILLSHINPPPPLLSQWCRFPRRTYPHPRGWIRNHTSTRPRFVFTKPLPLLLPTRRFNCTTWPHPLRPPKASSTESIRRETPPIGATALWDHLKSIARTNPLVN